MKAIWKAMLWISLVVLLTTGSYYGLKWISTPSPERLERTNEFTELCERNNGIYDNFIDACYIPEGDFVNIYQFTFNPDEKLRLFRRYN